MFLAWGPQGLVGPSHELGGADFSYWVGGEPVGEEESV